jgi:alpha/beta superfamily hydrolase
MQQREPAVPDGAATRIDASMGIAEEAAFLGDTGNRMFSVLHRPLDSPVAAVVVCPSLYADAIHNYRREVELARALAVRGIAVQRFHYRGTGQSDGDDLDLTYDRLRNDAEEAVAHAVAATGVDQLALVGTRLGSFVAAALAVPREGAPLAVWEPPLNARQYFREAFRAKLIREMRATETQSTTSAQLEQELLDTGWIDILGYTVGRRVFDTARDLAFAAELGDCPRPLLVVRLSASEVSRPLEEAVDQWTSRGFDVTVSVGHSREAWWFVDEHSVPTSAPVPATVEWLCDQLVGVGVP